MKAWQVCPNCSAVTYLWRDYAQRMGMAVYDQIHASMLAYPSGAPCMMYDPVGCQSCGADGYELLQPKWLRTGETPAPD